MLAHATGFHGRVFLPLAEHLREHFHCISFDLRGHGDSGARPDRDFAWQFFALDVLAVVDEVAGDHPLGLGHSCGGAALLLAEEARPGTFSQLYCFEPVVLPSDDPPPVDPSNHMSEAARRRREVFSSRSAALANYASKPPMTQFDDDTLRAYVEFGFDDLDDGTVRLKCRRDDEALVYQHGARHSAYAGLGGVRCPVTLACGAGNGNGTGTGTFSPAILELLAQRLPDGRVEVFDDLGHFGPLERPGEIAASVVRATDPARA